MENITAYGYPEVCLEFPVKSSILNSQISILHLSTPNTTFTNRGPHLLKNGDRPAAIETQPWLFFILLGKFFRAYFHTPPGSKLPPWDLLNP